MKTMSRKRKILAFVVSAFGISVTIGCCAYGTPYTTLKIKATVTDETNQPVSNAKLDFKDLNYNHKHLELVTDSKGKIDYSHDLYHSYYGSDNLKEGANIVFIGDHNAGLPVKYRDDSIRVQSSYKKGKGDWHKGTYEIKASLRLKKKTE